MRTVVYLFAAGFAVWTVHFRAAAAMPEPPAFGLRLEVVNQELRLRMSQLTDEGSLFLYRTADLSADPYAASVVLQTNISSGEGVLMTMPLAELMPVQQFYFAGFWPRFNPGTNLAYIPAGSFVMGSPVAEPARYPTEGPQTTVIISRGFWMGRHEVTQGEFDELLGRNPSHFIGNPRRPVEQVEWHEAMAYCDTLTSREQGAGRLPAGYVYRLPTEAEWEYACRAGTSSAFQQGDALRSGMANFQGTFEYPPCGDQTDHCPNPAGVFLGETAPVGSYAPNAWGLHDMHGNVYEWCADWWGESLPGGSVTDPSGPAETAPKVIRGGGWQSFAADCRSASRLDSNPIHGNYDVGFRVVLAPKL